MFRTSLRSSFHICLLLTGIGCHASAFQKNDFTVFSSHHPYAAEDEAMTYAPHKSGRSYLLNTNWSYSTGQKTPGSNSEIVDFPCKTDFLKATEQRSRLSRDVNLPDTWARRKVIIHFSQVSVEYKVFINNLLIETFVPIPGIANELDITGLIQNNSFRISLEINIREGVKQKGTLFEKIYAYTFDEIHVGEININGYISDDKPNLYIMFGVANYSVAQTKRNHTYRVKLYDEKGNNLIRAHGLMANGKATVHKIDTLAPAQKRHYSYHTIVDDAQPWTAETPNLYRITIEVFDDKESVIEAFSSQIGFRTFNLTGQDIRLNKSAIRLKGIEYKFKGELSEVEDYIGYLKSGNINAIKLKPEGFSPTLLSLCDKYGLYVICQLERDDRFASSPELLRNYYSLIQSSSAVIGWYSMSIPNLETTLGKIDREFNFWKNPLVCLANPEVWSGKKSLNRPVVSALPSDSTSLRELLAKANSKPLVLEVDHRVDVSTHVFGMLRSSLNRKPGLSGVFLTSLDEDSIPKPMIELYETIGFEKVSNTFRSISIINYSNFITTDSVQFNIRYESNGVEVMNGALPPLLLKPWEINQVTIPVVPEKHNQNLKLFLTARKKAWRGGEILELGSAEIRMDGK